MTNFQFPIPNRDPGIRPAGPRVARGLRLVLLLAAGCGFAVCAKKMLPPSPDRFAPRLEEVRTRNRVRLELMFDEGIKAEDLAVDSFEITGPDGSPLTIRGAAGGRRGGSVELWTTPQAPVVYEVRGAVVDDAGNPGRFRARFRGSDQVDTVPPRVKRITPIPGSAGQKMPSVRLEFSEPVDTAEGISWLFVPARWDTAFEPNWASDWQGFSLSVPVRKGDKIQRPLPSTSEEGSPPGVNTEEGASDSAKGIAYFLVLPGVKDLEGNESRSSAFTYFTPDSALEGTLVHGKAAWQEGSFGTGVVFFNSDQTPGMAPILADSSFAARLAPGEYSVMAVADTNGDRLADFASSPFQFNTQQESLELLLLPESLPRAIPEYRNQ